jgi:hypothetical protein
MPTLTRLAALLLFGAAAYHLTELYYTVHALGRRSQATTYIMVVFASLVGWRLVGPKIDRSVFRALVIVGQGAITTLFFVFVFSGLLAIFTNPSHRRYNNLEQAINLLVFDMWRHILRLFTTDFVLRILESGAFVALVLVAVFRVSEARRLAR